MKLWIAAITILLVVPSLESVSLRCFACEGANCASPYMTIVKCSGYCVQAVHIFKTKKYGEQRYTKRWCDNGINTSGSAICKNYKASSGVKKLWAERSECEACKSEQCNSAARHHGFHALLISGAALLLRVAVSQ